MEDPLAAEGDTSNMVIEEASIGTVALDKGDTLAIDRLGSLDDDSQLKLESLATLYKFRSMDFTSASCGASKASFMQWHSQGNLLMEMKRENARMRSEANSLFDGPCSDSADIEPEKNRTEEHQNRDNEDSSAYLHDIFFTPESKMQPINNEAVKFLLKTFRCTEDTKLISVPFELTSQIETFRSSIFDAINKEFKSIHLSEALLTVAFNHYGGQTRPGFMTIDEYMSMVQLYPGVFSTDDMAKVVFDSMDRRRRNMVSLNDFIAGMVSCSPRASNKVNNPSGRLRLQHIFRAYDVKRKGYLNASDIRAMLEHIELNARMHNTENENGMSSPYNLLIKSEYDSNEESDRWITEAMDVIMSSYEHGFGYDAFYTCVSNGTIKGTNLLLRSDKDFAEAIEQHLIHGLSHVVVPSEVNLHKEETKPDSSTNGMGRMASIAESPATMSPSKFVERGQRPSLWSTANSPRSPERIFPGQQPFSSIFSRDDGQRIVQSSRGRMLTTETGISASARDRFTTAVAGMDKKPLFQQSGAKSNTIDTYNYLAPVEHGFRKNQQNASAMEYINREPEYYSRRAAFGRHASVNAPLLSTRWSAGALEEERLPMNSLETGEQTRSKQPSTWGITGNTLERKASSYGAPLIMHSNGAQDNSGLETSDWKQGSMPTRNYGTNMETSMLKPVEGSQYPKSHMESSLLRGVSPLSSGLAQNSTTGVFSMPTMPVTRSNSKNNARALGVDTRKEDVTHLEAASTDTEGKEQNDTNGDLINEDGVIDLNAILSRRLTDLFRRYRARFVGFNSRMLSDHGVALKVFGKLYTRTFKCNEYNKAFERFEWCSYNELVELCDVTSGVVRQEPCVVKLQGTTQAHGPLNGNVAALIESFNLLGWPVHGHNSGETNSHPSQYAKGEATKLLFLGDLISEDEGYSLETLTVLFSLKVLFPYHVVLLRGRRESERRNYKSPLFREIYAKLTRNSKALKLEDDEALILQSAHELYHRILDVFENLSVAASIEDRVLCVHGSVSKTFRSIQQLEKFTKPISMKNLDDIGEASAHLRFAIFGSFTQDAKEGKDTGTLPQITQEELKISMQKSDVSMIICSGSTAERGYNYVHGERVLQLGGCSPGGTYSVALLKEHRSMHYFLTHRSIQVP